jgi:arylsulfatase A
LDRHDLANNTLVVFTTDNGGDPDYGGSSGPLRGEKNTLFEGGDRVPCLMRWPVKIRSGSVNNVVRSSLDLFPTFCSLAGADASSFTLDGVDLAPLQLGDGSAARELFWELPHSAAIRSGPWKYVRAGESEEYLFNVDEDVIEQHDLAQAHPDILRRLKQRHADLATACRKSANGGQP